MAKTKPKYKDYAALSAAFKSGELDAKKYYIMLDKGGADASLCFQDENLSEEDNEAMNDKCASLFDPKYSDHIDDLYSALGIPMQWC